MIFKIKNKLYYKEGLKVLFVAEFINGKLYYTRDGVIPHIAQRIAKFCIVKKL